MPMTSAPMSASASLTIKTYSGLESVVALSLDCRSAVVVYPRMDRETDSVITRSCALATPRPIARCLSHAGWRSARRGAPEAGTHLSHPCETSRAAGLRFTAACQTRPPVPPLPLSHSPYGLTEVTDRNCIRHVVKRRTGGRPDNGATGARGPSYPPLREAQGARQGRSAC